MNNLKGRELPKFIVKSAVEFVVLESKPARQSKGLQRGEIILCKLYNNATKYVTWWHSLDDGGYVSGHYFGDLKDALEDYGDRN